MPCLTLPPVPDEGEGAGEAAGAEPRLLQYSPGEAGGEAGGWRWVPGEAGGQPCVPGGHPVAGAPAEHAQEQGGRHQHPVNTPPRDIRVD